ncbi:hypothetical protein EDD18DRAFT_1144667 [Armillaria luteobubalina]|uniref:Uncharacterized protein n=1 Tax=Armillaria luteobubalina TaxID=153913 RepID=A0AA39QHN1_9AGAR|nr:hypothetical protein EDD18DRAFT_1144667 [Armillaria luteobubalina]
MLAVLSNKSFHSIGILAAIIGWIWYRITTASSQGSTYPCAAPIRDNCSFYSSCLETRYHCGPTGYPIGYGEKFCTKFSDDRALLSAKGQTWMVDTMHCLQESLVPDALGSAETCSQLEDKAFGTHAKCYIDNGLCFLPVVDWEAIVKIVELRTLFQSWDAFLETLKAAESCLEAYSHFSEHALG